MWTGEVRVEDGRYGVEARIVRCGQDVSVIIGGGEAPHIGASAVAIPRPSLCDPEKISASTSVICVPGHKEDLLVRAAAERIASALNCTTCVSAGVHIDNAQREELLRLQRNLDELLDRVMETLKNA